MAPEVDVIVVGGGLNGLVAAFDLARAGRRPLVVERRAAVGGTASTEEFAPGFRAPALHHLGGPLRPGLAEDLRLAARGVEMLESPWSLFAPAPDGRAVLVHRDAGITREALRTLSPGDAERYREVDETVGRIAAILSDLLDRLPPDIEKPALGEILPLLRTVKRIRDLGRRDLYHLLRWMPMALADLTAEWFETDLLRAAIAARGLVGSFAGPWSAGTGATWFLRAAADPHLVPAVRSPRGGPGALTQAIAAAAREAGADVRLGAEVTRIDVRDGAAQGVTLRGGERLEAETIVSGLDPKRTLLSLVEPGALPPVFRRKVRNIRMRGVTAKVHLALRGLPAFTALESGPAARVAAGGGGSPLAGRIVIAPGIDVLERAFDAAKYGEPSETPFLEATIPTILDPTLAPSGRHVLSVLVQYAPYHLRSGDWEARRAWLGDTVVKTLAAYAPGLPDLVEHGQVATPADLEQTFGLTEGHLHQGEESLDQIFTMRPVLDWARHRTPIRGLFLCGAGTHPGGGLTGANGRNAARAVRSGR